MIIVCMSNMLENYVPRSLLSEYARKALLAKSHESIKKMLNIINVVVAGSFLLPGLARDTACQPNTTQLTTEAFWTGRRGVSEVRYNLFNSEFGFCDILSSL